MQSLHVCLRSPSKFPGQLQFTHPRKCNSESLGDTSYPGMMQDARPPWCKLVMIVHTWCASLMIVRHVSWSWLCTLTANLGWPWVGLLIQISPWWGQLRWVGWHTMRNLGWRYAAAFWTRHGKRCWAGMQVLGWKLNVRVGNIFGVRECRLILFIEWPCIGTVEPDRTQNVQQWYTSPPFCNSVRTPLDRLCE